MGDFAPILAGIAALAIMFWFWLSDRRHLAPPAATSAAPVDEDPERRGKAIAELQIRLEKLKRKLDDTAQAVDEDPKRAARAVRQMMKQK